MALKKLPIMMVVEEEQIYIYLARGEKYHKHSKELTMAQTIKLLTDWVTALFRRN